MASPYFVVEMFELKEPQNFRTRDESPRSSVQILIAVEGCGIIEAHGMEPVTLAKGDAVVVPAALEENFCPSAVDGRIPESDRARPVPARACNQDVGNQDVGTIATLSS